jgi:hypothetical protein
LRLQPGAPHLLSRGSRVRDASSRPTSDAEDAGAVRDKEVSSDDFILRLQLTAVE